MSRLFGHELNTKAMNTLTRRDDLLKDESEVNAMFWKEHQEWEEARPTVRMGEDYVYKTDIRVAYCEFVENLVRSGQITEDFASEVTL